LGHQRVEDRPEHHAVAEPTERRRDHGFATPGRPSTSAPRTVSSASGGFE
jgi:hypothetical protein